MTCAQGLLRLLWGGARSWSATGLERTLRRSATSSGILGEIACKKILMRQYVTITKEEKAGERRGGKQY